MDCEGLYRSLEGRSSQWTDLQKAHLKLSPICLVCGTKRRRQVHHIKPYHLFPELELDPTNLITLCLPHHLLVGHLQYWRSWNPQVVEMAAMLHQAILLRP